MTRHLTRTRVVISSGYQTALSAGSYLRAAGRAQYAARRGTVLPKAGSILGISGCADCTAHTTTGDLDFSVTKNGGAVVFSATVSISGTGNFTVVATQDPGTDTFVAGDTVEMRILFQGLSNYSVIPEMMVELEFDT